ncbi:hypothetical protein [Aquimarina longa]|uniref:hypothetical protein n=1 Tax=Aquimarina longa TaxID=1080221 RepID=UPI000780634E|nr:hypothetical protein [Aquimarina longa]
MAKRFTDSQKYRKHFFRQLPQEYKLFWDFLYHECDHAGIWICDFEVVQIYLKTKVPITAEKALKIFNKEKEKIVVLDNDKKWFIPSFITFQYGKELKEKIKVHFSAMKILEAHGINPKTLKQAISAQELFLNTKEPPDSSEEILYSEFPKDIYISILRLAEVYIKDKKLLSAVSTTTKKKVSTIKKLIPDFVKNLESQGKNKENALEFATYFKNWLKYQEEPTKSKNNSNLKWGLLSTKEQYELGYNEQVELIKKRMLE